MPAWRSVTVAGPANVLARLCWERGVSLERAIYGHFVLVRARTTQRSPHCGRSRLLTDAVNSSANVACDSSRRCQRCMQSPEYLNTSKALCQRCIASAVELLFSHAQLADPPLCTDATRVRFPSLGRGRHAVNSVLRTVAGDRSQSALAPAPVPERPCTCTARPRSVKPIYLGNQSTIFNARFTGSISGELAAVRNSINSDNADTRASRVGLEQSRFVELTYRSCSLYLSTSTSSGAITYNPPFTRTTRFLRYPLPRSVLLGDSVTFGLTFVDPIAL